MYPKYTELYKAESRYCHDIGPLNFNLGYKIYDENNFKKIISKIIWNCKYELSMGYV